MRKKGQVAQSKELVGLAVLLATATAISLMAPTLIQTLVDYLRETIQVHLSRKPNLQNPAELKAFFTGLVKVLAAVGLPIAVSGFAAGLVVQYAQVGIIFSLEPMKPSLDKINPLSGFLRLFSMKHLIESVRIIVKFFIVLAISISLIKAGLLEFPRYLFMSPWQAFANLGGKCLQLFFSLCAVLGIFAGIDFYFQKREFWKKVRLTKAEAKQESKEQDGDPQLKAKVRQIQRDMARKRMVQAVKKADVIITNPTHIAIAIVYERGKHSAPRVVAKGADFLAQRIKKIAADAGVPLVENVPVARALYKSVKVGHTIPRNLYQAVAEVLAYVYRLKNKNI